MAPDGADIRIEARPVASALVRAGPWVLPGVRARARSPRRITAVLRRGSVWALPDLQAQTESLGISMGEIIEAVLRSAAPEPGLSWLDIGCGTGDLLRSVRDRYQPSSLTGMDLIDRLAADLVGDVAMRVGPAETSVVGDSVFDRVTLVETIEHLDAPWSVLESAIALVAPGGLIVVTTPNIATLRHRAELALRGTLTSFRPDNAPHQSPALPHVIERYMRQAGMTTSRSYAGRDKVPRLPMLLPRWFVRRWPQLGNISVICVGTQQCLEGAARLPGRAGASSARA